MSQNTSSDALSGLAPLLRVWPELQYVCQFGAQWASPHPQERDAWAPFHIVTDGACVMHLTTAGRSIQLRTGDVALLPRGSAHVMHSVTTSPTASGPFGIKGRKNGAILVKSNTEGETTAQLVCGRLKFDHAGQNLILSALPEAVVAAAAERADAFHIRRIITLVKEELDAARPGAAAIASDLASGLLVMVVRAHIEAERASDSLLALLGHPQGRPGSRRHAGGARPSLDARRTGKYRTILSRHSRSYLPKVREGGAAGIFVRGPARAC